MNIQNHFSDSALLSLAELKTRVEQDCKLDARKQREMVSAINTTAKWLNLSAEMIPASATFLRGKFQEIHPAHHHVAKRRVQNIKSLILSAMRSQGLSTKLGSYLAKMSPPWLKLWDIIEGEQYYRTEFSRFFRYCSKQGIAPNAISDHVLADYLQALEAESFVKTPKVRQQSICRLWNKCSELYQGQGWPQIKVTVPCYETRRYALNNDEFPPILLRELKTYLASLSGTDPFNMQVKAFHTEVKRRQTHTASQKTVVQKELSKVETGIKRCVDLLLHSDTPMESIRNTLEELEVQKRGLTRELSLQTEEDKIVLHPNIGELYARKIGDLKSLLQSDTTKHQATEIIRSLIEKIVVSPTGQRGKSDVVLHGALASILAYASDTAQNGAVSSGVGRVLLVAGAGFEPATFRL